MLTKEQTDRLWEAQDILLSVFWDIRDQRGSAKEAKRLDSILGKIDNLLHMKGQNNG